MASVKLGSFPFISMAILIFILCDKSNNWSIVSHKNFFFISLFVFRYLRLIVHIISFWFLYRPATIQEKQLYQPSDVTVIVPTVDPENRDFAGCISTIMANKPKQIIIVAVGSRMASLTEKILTEQQLRSQEVPITVLWTAVANKRVQITRAIPRIQTAITAIVDDHVFWRSPNFLPAALAAFEDPKVGAVGTNKRAIRTEHGFTAASFWNMLGALYLERQNFDVRATNAIDGGLFVNSGRTYAHRTRILQSEQFLTDFLNDRFFFNLFGPLNCDDDNFITRFEFKHGWDIKIQHCEDTLVETPLGTYPRFISQCLRWVRTTWRSNFVSLVTDCTPWKRHPWCVYAVYLTSFVNFALFYDAALVYSVSKTTWGSNFTVALMVTWIFLTKMVKLAPYFWREPQDLVFLPGYVVFAYFHSLIKLYALFTFWDIKWCGRDLNGFEIVDPEHQESEKNPHSAIK